MNVIDLLIVFSWLGFTLAIGMWAGAKASPVRFWINDRGTGMWPLVASVVSTQIGSGALIGIASATYSAGTGFALVSLFSTVTGFIFLGFFAKRIRTAGEATGAITLPELFAARYNRKVQVAASVIIALTYVALLAAQFQASSVLLSVSAGLSVKTATFITIAVVVLYSAYAGLRGDIATDVFHFLGMCLVFFFVLTPALLVDAPLAEIASSIPADILSPLTFGGIAFLIVGIPIGFVVPLLSSELWMKIYSSGPSVNPKRVLLISSLVVIPFYLMATYLGFATYVELGPVSDAAQSDSSVMATFLNSFPNGLAGLGIATVLAVIVSTANTYLVVIGSVISRDVLGLKLDNKRQFAISKLVIVGVGAVAAIMAFASPSIVKLLLAGFYALFAVGPAIFGLFVFRRATATAAFWSIVSGFIVSVISILTIPDVAFLPILIVSVAVMVVVTRLTKHSSVENPNLTFSGASGDEN